MILELIDVSESGVPTRPGRYLVRVRARNGAEYFEILEWFERGGWRQHPSRVVLNWALLAERTTEEYPGWCRLV